MRRGSFLVLLTLIASAACKRDVVVSEPEARTLATQALARYCESHKLSPQYFRLTEIGPNGSSQWEIVYVSSGIKPAQEISIGIGKDGSVDVSMMTEGRED